MARNNKSDIAQIARDAGLRTFEDSSGVSNKTAFASQQTAAVTHYYDSDTLACFRCSVRKVATFDGIVMATICYQDVSYDHKKGFVIVAHDLGGWTINRTNVDDHFKSYAAAEKEFWRICNELDTRTILRDVIERELRKAKQAQKDLSKGLRKVTK